MTRRVYVSGVGVVTPIGTGKRKFWNNLIKGKSGISNATLFSTSRFSRHKAGEVKDFVPTHFIDKKLSHFFGRASQFAIAGTAMALEDAGIDLGSYKGAIAVIAGSTMTEARDIDYSSGKLYNNEKDKINRKHMLSAFSPSISRNIGYYFEVKGMNLMIPCACAAGNYAIGYGYDLIRSGKCDLAIVGGADALSRGAFQGFHRIYAMSPDKCTPFDKNRKGMILGEGAGILILESESSIANRKARSYAEVLGYGLSCDAYHITIPNKRGVKKAMMKAVKNAGLVADDIDYVSAHGTGTSANDREESGAIKEIFGQRRVAVSSIKSMLGHCMGAASSIEAITCCLAIQNSLIPPTINFKTPDPACDIDCVPNKARRTKVKYALNNGFAFGGNNCCVVLGRK
jgi:3-oxoacyl-[acyl-carrier-protein] synthase II